MQIRSLVGKIPWRKKWQPTPVFLPEKSHGQRSLVYYSPRGLQRVRHNWVYTYTHTHTHTHTHYPSLSLIAYLGLKSALSEINIIYIFFLLFPCICPPSLSSPRWIVTWSVNTISLLWHKLKWKIIIYKKLNPLILLPLWFKSLIFLLRSNSSNSTTELTVITIFRGKKDLKRKQQTTVVLVENGSPYPPHQPPPLPGISE